MERYELICNNCSSAFTCVAKKGRRRYNLDSNFPVFNEYNGGMEKRIKEGDKCPKCGDGRIIPHQIEEYKFRQE